MIAAQRNCERSRATRNFVLTREIWRCADEGQPTGRRQRTTQGRVPYRALKRAALDSFGRSNVPSGHYIDLQFWVGRRNICSWQSKLAAHDICALRDGARLVEGDFPVCSLSAKTAVARYDQALRSDDLQRVSDLP